MRLYTEKTVWLALSGKLFGMSQKEAAKAIGISPQCLSRALREGRMTGRMASWIGFRLESAEMRRLFVRRG